MKIENKKNKNINLQNVVNILLPILREKSTFYAVSKIFYIIKQDIHIYVPSGQPKSWNRLKTNQIFFSTGINAEPFI